MNAVRGLWPAHQFNHRGAFKPYWLLKCHREISYEASLGSGLLGTIGRTALSCLTVWSARTNQPMQLNSVCYSTKDWFEDSITPSVFFHPKHPLKKRKLHTFYISLCIKKNRLRCRYFTVPSQCRNLVTMRVRGMKIILSQGMTPKPVQIRKCHPICKSSSSIKKKKSSFKLKKRETESFWLEVKSIFPE